MTNAFTDTEVWVPIEDHQKALAEAWLAGARAAWEITSPRVHCNAPTWTYALPRRVRRANPYEKRGKRR